MTPPAFVIPLSIDGLSAAALADSTVSLPSLRGLISRGVHARRLTPVFPSVTWPCHTSIVTGVSPARHGVLGNMVFDRASHSANSPIHEAYAKLKSEAGAARLLRERHPR